MRSIANHPLQQRRNVTPPEYASASWDGGSKVFTNWKPIFGLAGKVAATTSPDGKWGQDAPTTLLPAPPEWCGDQGQYHDAHLHPPRRNGALKACLIIRLLMFASGPILSLCAAEFVPPLKTEDGFAVPQPGRVFEFPRDHGSHPEFKIEWWYVTGHLFGEQDRRFGFQATFFRRAGPSTTHETAGSAGSPWFGDRELHLAHMALVDVQEERFFQEERLNRKGWDAGSATNTLFVWNGNWSLRLGTNANQAMSLQGSIRGEASFSLDLTPLKPLVVFGENGVSRKGASATAASYYLTFPRLEVTGELMVDGEKQTVRGQAWMDHEISSSQLDQDQAGWDWASLQLNDGREIMSYRMRKLDGSTDPFSQLAWVDAEGKVTHFTSAQFKWSTERTWKSPRTGGEYPVQVTLATIDPVTNEQVTLTLKPLLLEQELTGTLGGIAYWEGACRVLNEKGEDVGSAYLELAGYVGSLSDRFK
jgi:predicted secreted hydrolase